MIREAAALVDRGVAFAVATVVSAKGSVPGKVGATMLVLADGSTRGTVGGAGLEERVRKLALDALSTGAGGVHAFDLANWKPTGLDSVCGGTVEIAISVSAAPPHLLLVGGGHCAHALAAVADALGWSYTVLDSRAAFANAERFPRARETVAGAPSDFVAKADLSRYSHAYVMGHSHHEDVDTLVALLKAGFPGVVGVIGSAAKRRSMWERAAARGAREEDLVRVRMPIGVDVGAETPAEIAVSVAAEIVRDVRQGSGSK